MKRLTRIIIAALLSIAPALAFAQSTTTDQLPVPLTSSAGQSELLTQSQSVPGGTLYTSVLRPSGLTAQPSIAATFVPVGAASPTRYLALTGAKSDLGVPMTAAAGTPSGTVGVSRTAGTSLTLVGEATSSSAKTNKALFEFDLPDTYVAGANIPVIVNAIVAGSGTLTGASTSITVAAYTETNGVEAALTVSAAQLFDKTGETLTFTVTGTGLVPGQHVALELVMLVTSASGANTGTLNSVAFQG